MNKNNLRTFIVVLGLNLGLSAMEGGSARTVISNLTDTLQPVSLWDGIKSLGVVIVPAGEGVEVLSPTHVSWVVDGGTRVTPLRPGFTGTVILDEGSVRGDEVVDGFGDCLHTTRLASPISPDEMRKLYQDSQSRAASARSMSVASTSRPASSMPVTPSPVPFVGVLKKIDVVRPTVFE